LLSVTAPVLPARLTVEVALITRLCRRRLLTRSTSVTSRRLVRLKSPMSTRLRPISDST